ncbi:MAG: putative sulfate exporter family transporter [Bacteriovorax sp.]|nr:putative sulfate exporter family transporter [Bacteriovorax sp.]
MKKILFILILIFCLTPWCSSAIALFLGLALSFTVGNPFSTLTKKHTSTLLQYSVIGLGAGMNLKVVSIVGLQGIGYTVTGIAFTGLIGWLFFKLLKTSNKVSILITAGTAICGGSAIAAISPIISAEDHDISISLATVFILNAAALFIFPTIGHALSLSQHQFGLWAALAIHDTSSVVGASMQYGSDALQIATTVKLARALWIIPVSFLVAIIMRRVEKSKESKKIKKPWFILGFILMAALVTWVPSLELTGHQIASIAKKALVVTLFFIGSGLSLNSLKEVGVKPLVLGMGLWIIVASTTLYLIKLNIIH